MIYIKVNVVYFFVNDNVNGFYLGWAIWIWGLWKGLWISGEGVGFCFGIGCGEDLYINRKGSWESVGREDRKG